MQATIEKDTTTQQVQSQAFKPWQQQHSPFLKLEFQFSFTYTAPNHNSSCLKALRD